MQEYSNSLQLIQHSFQDLFLHLLHFIFIFEKLFFPKFSLNKYIMSQSTNTSVINFCDVCKLSFESKKGLYRHQSYDLKHKELMEKMFESNEEEILEKL